MNQYNTIYQQYKVPETYQLTFNESTGSIMIGAGYNLSEHTPQEIFNDLSQAGFDRYTASVLSGAALKTGASAQDWIIENRFLVISEQQHQDLFEQVVIPQYEGQLAIQLQQLQTEYPTYFSESIDNLTESQKEILFQFVNYKGLSANPQLTYAVIHEDWNSVKTELTKDNSEVSDRVLNTFFNKNTPITQEEETIDLTIPTNYDFTYNQEIGHQGQSLIPHYPGDKSGVTIGPGYDMGHRTHDEIYKDLTAAGIDPDIVQALMQASNKIGPDAQSWVSSHADLQITEEQQRYLFYEVLVPEYESRTQEQLNDFLEKHPEIPPQLADWDNLSDKQRQMLFDFTYNAGLEKFPSFVKAVLTEDWENAYHSFERYSAGELLSFRNESFYDEFLEDDLHYNYDNHNQISSEINELDLF
jgi:hypothetical protein